MCPSIQNLLTCVVPSSRVDATLEDLHEVE